MWAGGFTCVIIIEIIDNVHPMDWKLISTIVLHPHKLYITLYKAHEKQLILHAKEACLANFINATTFTMAF